MNEFGGTYPVASKTAQGFQDDRVGKMVVEVRVVVKQREARVVS